MSKLENVTVDGHNHDLEILCDKCRNPLDITTTDGSYREGLLLFEVAECETCCDDDQENA